jgi:hypothetical protein
VRGGKKQEIGYMRLKAMWDTIDGKVDENVLSQLASGKVFDACTTACKILQHNAKVVSWINEPALICKS